MCLFSGGKVEPQEVGNPAVSAVREAREEAGVIGKRLSLAGISGSVP
jgi:8-oxo-dGTP pyrophosphatase MutT (NUDIX family)